MSLPASAAQHAFQQGVKNLRETARLLNEVKLRALAAGRHFRQAQLLCEDGEFGAYCEAAEVSRMTVWRFVELVNRCELEIKELHPALKGARLDAAVDSAILSTPKDLTAIMRELGIIKQVGAYDAADYQNRKLAGTPQLVFAFEHFESQVRALVQTEQVFELSRSSLLKLKTELEEARAKVEEALAGKAADHNATRELKAAHA